MPFPLEFALNQKIEVEIVMNYNEFMKAVDEKLLAMSEMEKTEWIHNMARITKEHERITFLNSLDGKQDYCSIIYEKELIKEWCREVEDGEIYFECSGYKNTGIAIGIVIMYIITMIILR